MSVINEILSIIIGYVFSLIIAFPLTYYFAHFLGKAINEFQGEKEYYRWTAALVGTIERLLYTSAVLVDQLNFIALWLAVKTVSQWRRWGEKEESSQKETNPYQERANFNSYLINTGLSITYGVLGGKIPEWLKDNHMDFAITCGSGLVLLNIIFIGIAYFKYSKQSKRVSKNNKSEEKKTRRL